MEKAPLASSYQAKRRFMPDGLEVLEEGQPLFERERCGGYC